MSFMLLRCCETLFDPILGQKRLLLPISLKLGTGSAEFKVLESTFGEHIIPLLVLFLIQHCSIVFDDYSNYDNLFPSASFLRMYMPPFSY